MIDLIHCTSCSSQSYTPSCCFWLYVLASTDVFPTVQTDKGGNPEVVRESQRKRGAPVEIVDEVMELFNQHKAGAYEPHCSLYP